MLHITSLYTENKMNTSKINHKHSITILFLMGWVMIGCQTPPDISGRLDGTIDEGTKVYVIQPASLRQVSASYFGNVIDSAVVTADGSFEFSNLPKSGATVLLELVLQATDKAPNYLQTDNPAKANFMPIVWQPEEPLQITSHSDGFQRDFSMEDPSGNNIALLALRDISQRAYQHYLEGKVWHVEDGTELLEKEHAQLNYQSELIAFAEQTPYLLPALVALRWVSHDNYYERVPEFLVNQCTRWKQEQPDHPWVAELCQQSDPANLPVLKDSEFPNVGLPLLSKDTVDLYQALGDKLTIVDLWASWCAPCRKENREVLVPLWDEYHDQGLQIIAYGLESDESNWIRAITRDGADRWMHASDLQGDDASFLKRIRVQTIPANFILDAQGIVIAKNLHGKELKEWVASYMNK